MELEFKVRDRVLLERGTWVRVTDKVDRESAESLGAPDDLCVGIDNIGKWHVFPEWEVLEVVAAEV